MDGKIRRVVTGHDSSGKAVVVADSIAPAIKSDPKRPGRYITQLWVTDEVPVTIGNEPDPTSRPLTLSPPPRGAAFRIVEMPPDKTQIHTDAQSVQKSFAELGAGAASTQKSGAPHPYMHRTETLDYGIVLSGEAYLILDDSEVLMKEGDVVIQRGTNHSWSNRSDQVFRIAFFMIGGLFAPEIAALHKKDH